MSSKDQRKRRDQLEERITTLLQDFHVETGLIVDSLEVRNHVIAPFGLSDTPSSIEVRTRVVLPGGI